jgi:hypothetical protein
LALTLAAQQRVPVATQQQPQQRQSSQQHSYIQHVTGLTLTLTAQQRVQLQPSSIHSNKDTGVTGVQPQLHSDKVTSNSIVVVHHA